ncbi:uncharacterized protein TM35_000311100 [Trypanosoma theileri]|uniref:Translation-associated element 2 n=1 Tax=Trypanosoma theileri TaxID=67003 RepID=A0A1X0NMG1_9TRYP|nr:uncharacterized protein TM35_000311100 [Trypanosoma theileri]ORC85924.1 hypothetical protein TM35_000311100 [Trypanosoma theileri]
MVKQRMTALDVRASVEEMRSSLVGLRLLNIYDISPKMFLFKFGHGENKKTMILETGVRMHLTQLVREKPKVPSQFTLKLRKHVRAWRLDSVTQLQHDRTVDFRFGVSEDASYHIIIELFSKGNIILTDHEYRIMLLLRTHRDDDIKMCVRELYPVTSAFDEQQAKEQKEREANCSDMMIVKAQRTEALRQEWNSVFTRHADYETTRSTLSAVHHFGPSLADHILAVTGVKNVKKGDMTCSGEELFTQLLPGMLEAWEIAYSALPPGGYLIRNIKQKKDRKGKSDIQQKQEEEEAEKQKEEPNSTNTMIDATTGGSMSVQAAHYDDFSPVLLAQYRGDGVVTSFLPSFGNVCDTFFLSTETEKIDQHNEKKTTTVLSKRERFERDHQRRINALERQEEENQRKGECIIHNADKVDEAIGLINGALAAGIQWDALRRLLKQRHAEGHPVAYMVHELFLERNSISVLLLHEKEDTDSTTGKKDNNNKDNKEDDEDEDEDEEEDEEKEDNRIPLVVEVELSKTAYANATTYFAKKKANRAKHEKTVAATAKALAGAEKKGERVAAKQQMKKAIIKERHRCWWEKFAWFRTSCGDLVIQGRDVATTEILIRRVMQLGDIFVHCDVEGAFPCLLRPADPVWMNAKTTKPSHGQVQQTWAVHLTSLDEAGGWCVSRSSAWESKFSIGAWWVYASQIVGGTASGCYLLEGEKHYLRPQPLTLACGLLFHVTSRTINPQDGQELPNFISHNNNTNTTNNNDNDNNIEKKDDEEEEDQDNSGLFLPPDTASALHPLPSVEELRGPRRPPQHNQHNQQKQQRGGPPSSKGNQKAPPVFTNASTTTTMEEATVTTVSSTNNNQQRTKYQRKKLKKIQEKYKDQDDEDRLRGAFLNGNKLSKIQLELLALERNKEKHHDPQQPPPLPAETTKHEKNKGEKKKKQTEKVASESDHENDDDHEEHEEHSSSPGSNASIEGKGEEREEQEQEEEKEQKEEEQKQQHQKQKKDKNQPDSRASAEAVEALRAANNAEFRREWGHFTARPQPTDHIDYVVPMCAPMSCCATAYKYRTELFCGTAKKGQVAGGLQAQFISLTANAENASEVQAVRSLDVNDVMEQLRGNLKRLNAKLVK